MSSFDFNAVLLDISDRLSEEQIAKLKHLCQELIGKRSLEMIDSGIKLFQVLMERRKLAPDNREFLCELLTHIKREDLVQILTTSGSTAAQPDNPENAKLDIATEVIAENVGTSWRKLGRRLGLTDVKLESIFRRHPTELDETTLELLKEWRKSRGPEARTDVLIQALRACELNLTADKVECRLDDMK